MEEYVKRHFDFIDSGASDRVIDWLVLGKLPEDVRAGLERVKEENARRRALDFLPEGCKRTELGVLKEGETL